MEERKWSKCIEENAFARKWLFSVLVFAWVMVGGVLLKFEVGSFHFKDTWKLRRDERQVFFVKREFTAGHSFEFDDDYFELLRRAQSSILPRASPFKFYTWEKLHSTHHLRAMLYAEFWLAPSYHIKETADDKVFYSIYYQREPEGKDEVIVEKIEGVKPSFITRVVR